MAVAIPRFRRALRRRRVTTGLALSLVLGANEVMPASALASAFRGPADSAPDADPAAAQRREEGTRLYEEGSVKYDAGDYSGAVTSFKASFDLLGEPLLLYNIAVCHDRLDQFAEALEYFARYRAVADSSEHANVDRRVASVETRRDAAASADSSPPRGASGKRNGGEEPRAIQVTPRDDGGERPARVFSPAVWGLTAGAVVAFGFGLGFGLASLSQDRKAEDGCPDVGGVGRVCGQEGKDALAKGKTFGIVADVSIGVGGALAVGAVVVLIVNATRRKRGAKDDSRAHLTPSLMGLAGRF
jgi:hypothetical protein